MRIGIVLPNVPRYSETFFISKIKILIHSGHDVILFVSSKKETFQLCKVVHSPRLHSFIVLRLISVFLRLFYIVLRSPKHSYLFLRLERKTGRSWGRALENLYINSSILPYDLDWLHFGFITMALRRENTPKAIGAKMSISLRGYDVSLHPLGKHDVYKHVWPRVDKVHTISNALLRKAFSLGLPVDVPSQRITPAIDVNYFQSEIACKKFSSPLQLLTIARLHWVKGIEYVFEALSLLNKLGIQYCYTVIGEGPEFERLAFAAYQLGIGDRIFFKGKVSHYEVREHMRTSDIYIQYSVQEGFCNAVLEAQAMGLLSVVSDAEGLPENVLHEDTGWVVPRRNPGALVKQLSEIMLMQDDFLERIRTRAKERVKNEFNLEIQQKLFDEFFMN